MNQANIIGRLVRDPERKELSSTTVTSFTVAVDRPYAKNKETDFISVKVFGPSADNCAKYLGKGSQVGVSGRIQTGSYKKKDGSTVYTTDIVAERVDFLGGKKTSENGNQSPYEGFHECSEGEDEDDFIPF